MGTPADPLGEPGPDQYCWDVGENYAPGPSKLYLTIEFLNIEKGDLWTPAAGEPLNGRYTIERYIPPPPDTWSVTTPDYEVIAMFLFNSIAIQLTGLLGGVHFYHNYAPRCTLDKIPNLLTDPELESFVNGTCQIFVPGVNI